MNEFKHQLGEPADGPPQPWVMEIRDAPAKPGCYIMRDAKGAPLYVGKAKNLRARLRNYVNETDGRHNVAFLKRRVARVDWLEVAGEKEALLLENSLIKEYKPRYNIRLRDDKTYISLRIDPRQAFSRITVARRYKKDGARYFGPYHDTQAARKTMKQLQRLFRLRCCGDSVMNNRARPCIYYQMNQCAAPCVGLISKAAYHEAVKQAVLVLEGRSGELEKELLHSIAVLASETRFEEAAILRDRLYDLRATLERQRTVIPGAEHNLDAFGLYREGDHLEVQVLHYRGGAMVGGRSFSFEHAEAPPEETFPSFLLQYYDAGNPIPDELLLPCAVEDARSLADVLGERRGARLQAHFPRRRPKSGLIALAAQNARRAFEDKHCRDRILAQALDAVRQTLALPRVPERIECFDVSTTQGNQTVAAMTVFERGVPAKARYRRYLMRLSEGQDDFMAMREALSRRYTRALREEDLPDLLLIDGGKGHLNAAVAVLRELGLNTLPCVAIAKARQEDKSVTPERFFIPGRANPIVPPQSGPVARLLSQIRDETHRFALSYHRKKRGKATITSALLEIPGIGPARARCLLRAFGSIASLREATLESLRRIPGIDEKLAREIPKHLKQSAVKS